jgi:hypothetical protein
MNANNLHIISADSAASRAQLEELPSLIGSGTGSCESQFAIFYQMIHHLDTGKNIDERFVEVARLMVILGCKFWPILIEWK